MSTDKTKLGDRMKSYEQLEDGVFMPRLPIVCRMDGRSFSSWTRDLNRPYDARLSRLMIETTRLMVRETNALVGYTQSDEITLVLYAENYDTQLWFGSKTAKIKSHLAALTSIFFNRLLPSIIPGKVKNDYEHDLNCPYFEFDNKPGPDLPPVCNCGTWEEQTNLRQIPTFDARAFNVPNLHEAANAVYWREMDATRNSITMAARSYFSHKQLMNRSCKEMLQMLLSKGVDWRDYPRFFRYGTYVRMQPQKILLSEDVIKKIPDSQKSRFPDLPYVIKKSLDTLDITSLRNYTMDEKIQLLFR